MRSSFAYAYSLLMKLFLIFDGGLIVGIISLPI